MCSVPNTIDVKYGKGGESTHILEAFDWMTWQIFGQQFIYSVQRGCDETLGHIRELKLVSMPLHCMPSTGSLLWGVQKIKCLWNDVIRQCNVLLITIWGPSSKHLDEMTGYSGGSQRTGSPTSKWMCINMWNEWQTLLKESDNVCACEEWTIVVQKQWSTGGTTSHQISEKSSHWTQVMLQHSNSQYCALLKGVDFACFDVDKDNPTSQAKYHVAQRKVDVRVERCWRWTSEFWHP